LRIVEVKSQSAPRSLTGRCDSYEDGQPLSAGYNITDLSLGCDLSLEKTMIKTVVASENW